jgi:hypothetical protein
MAITIKGVQVENLRGYTSTYLPLDRRTTVVVGRNNSGKTSILRLLDWVLNTLSVEDVRKHWSIPDEVAAFLLPARDARHKARRLTVLVGISDGRSHRRYSCADGIASLRINVRLTPEPSVFVRLGEARRGEASQSSPRALELLEKLKESVRLMYVPSFRDAGSKRFKDTLHRSFAQRIKSRALHERQGGAPAEYRKMKSALDRVATIVEDLVAPLWPAMVDYLPPGLAADGAVELETNVEDLLDWATHRLELKVSTGEHDSSRVGITDVGSGLQSLLDLAVQQSDAAEDGGRTILVVEEPESFLHPSAQRVITRSLLKSEMFSQLVVTTHSSVVVDEARYGEVVICRDQNFYYPSPIEDIAREEINSALLTGQGAEMLFARSVLLVEGEGDRLFFEKIRRRLAVVDKSGRVDELYVVAVGGNQSYAPWLRLLESYGAPGNRPIAWLVVSDGDSGSALRRALSDSSVFVPQDVIELIGIVGAKSAEGTPEWVAAIKALNAKTNSAQIGFALLPVDLEHAVLADASPTTISKVCDKMGVKRCSLDQLLNSLGSKAVSRTGVPNKAPWIRGFLGAHMPWGELSEGVLSVMRRWLAATMSSDEIDALFDDAKGSTT